MRVCSLEIAIYVFAGRQSAYYIIKKWRSINKIMLNINKIRLMTNRTNQDVFKTNHFSFEINVCFIRNWRYIASIKRSI